VPGDAGYREGVCGRYATTRSAADLSALFEALDETDDPAPDYNVAPTDPAPAVRLDRAGDRVLSVGRWGLLPHWARDPRMGARMINARAETVATARAYAESFAIRRCLVPADGWYEWVRLGGPAAAPGGGRAARSRGRAGAAKQAYFMTPADGSVLALAGLWSSWGPGRLLTFCVVTTPAVGTLAAVHDRMPLALPPDRWAAWLEAPGPDPALLEPAPEWFLGGLEIRPVGPAVGNVHHDGPDLIARVPAAPLPDLAGPTLF